VTDPKVIDVLILKGQQEYQETLKLLEQEPSHTRHSPGEPEQTAADVPSESFMRVRLSSSSPSVVR